MKYVRFLPVLALVLITPAAAQVMQAPPLIQQVPVIINPQAEAELGPKVDLIATDPELARKTIDQLKRDNRELNAKLKEQSAKLTQALAMIDQITKPGGSLVRAYCEFDPRSGIELSKNTAGAEEDCAATGYKCNQVSGLCNRTATGSAMCAVGFVWDENQSCIRPRSN